MPSRLSDIDTAKAVLNAPREMLIEKDGPRRRDGDEVLRILKQEFEEENESFTILIIDHLRLEFDCKCKSSAPNIYQS